MVWYFLESALTLPILYAIVSTIIEFRYHKNHCRIIIILAILSTFAVEGSLLLSGFELSDIYNIAWITTCVPSFFCLLYLAKYRDLSFIFAFLTECLIASIITGLSYIFAFLLPWDQEFIPVILHFIILIALYLLCRKVFGERYYEAVKNQKRKWLIYCVLPIFGLITWVLYIRSTSHAINLEDKVSIPYAGYIYPQDIPPLIFLMLFVFFLTGLIIYVIVLTHQSIVESNERTVLDFQAKALDAQLKELLKNEESMRIIRHDFRHHIRVLSSMLQSEQYLKAITYLNSFDKEMESTKIDFTCPNAVIGAITSIYTVKAAEENIQFTHFEDIPGVLPVDDLDIGAAISNALENALNACVRMSTPNRYIDFKFVCCKKQYILELTNSFEGTVEFDNNGRPISVQENHGVGSYSIYAFCKKYNATIDYMAENGVFTMRLLFN